MNISQADGLGQAITALHPRQIGALPLVYPILNDLQVSQVSNTLVSSQTEIDVGRVVLLLTLNRLLAPQPLYHVQDWLAETVLPQVLDIAPEQAYDNRLGRTLDRLYPHLGALWVRLVSRAVQVYDIDLSVLHWDITSIYFEGAYPDSALVAYGYSRDQRADSKQVNLEMDVSHDGYVPLLYAVLPGRTADITRPSPHLEALLHFLSRPELADRHLRPVLVSDCKMVTPEAVSACHRHELFYLGPLPDGIATEALLRSVSSEELAAHPLAYRPQRVNPADPGFSPYQGAWRPLAWECARLYFSRGQRFTDRALVVWSAGKQRLDEQKRKSGLKRVLNGLNEMQKRLNIRRYRKRAYAEQRLAALLQDRLPKGLIDAQLSGEDDALQLTFRINRQRLQEVQALDGRYALATNAAHLDANETFALFKGQDGVEKRFATVKGPLAVHPLFVRSDRRIEGLVFITLLALLVRAILERLCSQRGIKATATHLFQDFARLQAVDLIWADGSCQRRAAQMSPLQTQVLNTLSWPKAEAYAQLNSTG